MICPECGGVDDDHDQLCWTAHDRAGTESMSAGHWRANPDPPEED